MMTDTSVGIRRIRRQAILKRWEEILLLSISGAAFVALGAAWLISLARSTILADGVTIPAGALLILVALNVARGRWLAWLGLRNLPTYPPAWISSVLGSVWLTAFWSAKPDAFAKVTGSTADRFLLAYPIFPSGAFTWLHAVLVLAALSLGTWMLTTWTAPTRDRREGRPGHSELPGKRDPGGSLTRDFAALKEWVRSDAEIVDPAQDVFGHDGVARRIVDRIIRGITDGFTGPTMAVVGELGSGKSSLRNLVARRLRGYGPLDRKVIFVPVSLWPFETPEAAVRGILGEFKNALSRHVNTAPLTTVPQEYVRIIEHSAGSWSPLARLLAREPSPANILQRFEDIAIAIDARVVLWVEDLERFAATENLSPAEIGLRDNLRLAPIRSLLHLLDRKEGISVVLAANALDARFDMDKLARFIEKPPRLEAARTAAVLRFFRSQCLEMLGSKIDPAAPPGQKRPDIFAAEHEMGPAELLGFPPLVKPLTTLCRTPRRLKTALRCALDVWEPLVGEVDFDDVFLMSILKATKPDVFALVEEYIDDLRNGPPAGNTGGQGEAPAFERLLNGLLEAGTDRSKAVREILNYVFARRHGGTAPDAPFARPQGFAVAEPVDYWRRFLSVPELGEDGRDQAILAQIQQWENDRSGDLPALVSGRERYQLVQHFSCMLSPAAFIDLLKAVIDLYGSKRPAEWTHYFDDPPDALGIVAIWQVRRKHSIDEGRLFSVLEAAVERFTPRNLALVRELIRLFATKEGGFTPERRIELVRRSTAALVRLSEQELVESLQGAHFRVLLRLLQRLGLDRDRLRTADRGAPPFDGWKRFSQCLVNAADEAPAVVLPQIVALITRHPDPPQHPAFDKEVAQALFDYEELLAVLRRRPLGEAGLQPEFAREYRAVMEAIGKHTR